MSAKLTEAFYIKKHLQYKIIFILQMFFVNFSIPFIYLFIHHHYL